MMTQEDYNNLVSSLVNQLLEEGPKIAAEGDKEGATTPDVPEEKKKEPPVKQNANKNAFGWQVAAKAAVLDYGVGLLRKHAGGVDLPSASSKFDPSGSINEK